RRRGGLGAPIVLAMAMLPAGAGRSAAGDSSGTILLGEAIPRGVAAQVRIELKAHGLFRPGPGPGGVRGGARVAKPLSIEVEAGLVFYERILEVAGDASAIQIGRGGGAEGAPRGRPRKAARHVVQAAAAINGEIRTRATSLRPEVSL